MSVDERDTVRAGGGHSRRSRLVDLLAQVAEQGWASDAGRQAIGIMRVACRREAAEWTRTAGWLTDEGLSVVWEQMDRLVRTGRFVDGPGLLRIAARRAYAAEAAAASTSRRCRSTMASHATGVPAATWSALELLTLGSGPGCRPEARTTGVAVQIDLAGAAGVLGSPNVMRIVRAAVSGRPVRTGRRRAA